MPIFQAYNKRNKAWVKYKFTRRGWKALDVKQKNPKKPFKGIQIRGKRRKWKEVENKYGEEEKEI